VALDTRLAGLFREYAESHRHPVNLAIHKVAIPLIVFQIIAVLDWVPIVRLPGTAVHVTLANIGYLAAVVWYLALDLPLGLCMAVLFGLCFPIGWITPRPIVVALALFAWAAQLAGHMVWEKKQPAFLHNLLHALVGPVYFVAVLLRRWPEHPRSDLLHPGSGA
jgi:uncharacterized membrane protein YGL010W